MAERALTLAEVAQRYELTERQLRDFVRRREIPVLTTGKAIRFDAYALTALEEAMRRCPSKSSAERIPERSRSPAPSSYRTGRGSAFELALNLTNCGSPEKRPQRLKPKSSETPGTGNVVVLDRSERQ